MLMVTDIRGEGSKMAEKVLTQFMDGPRCNLLKTMIETLLAVITTKALQRYPLLPPRRDQTVPAQRVISSI